MHNTPSLQPNRNSLIVCFDKKKQQQKKEKKGSIYLPQQFLYMEYYLQYGTVHSIGCDVLLNTPEIEIGDTVLVHHIVEDNPLFLVHSDSDFEYRTVNAICHKNDHSFSSQVYGIIKKDTNEIVPFDTFLFIETKDISPLTKQITSDLIIIPDYQNDEAFLQKMQEEHKLHMKTLEKSRTSLKSLNYLEDVETQINNLQMQHLKLTELISGPKLVNAKISYSNVGRTDVAKGETVMVEKDILYPLNIADMSWFLIRSEFVDKYDFVFSEG